MTRAGDAEPGYRSIVRSLRTVGLRPESRIIAHIDSARLGWPPEAIGRVLQALINEARLVMMPGFTFQTLVMPPSGPPDNGMYYNPAADNSAAIFWSSDLPVHPQLGTAPELFRHLPTVIGSTHPVLRFLAHGVEAREALAGQTLSAPWAPLDWLARHGGEVMLLGATQSDNLCLHLAQQRAGLKQFTRWALTKTGVVEVPNWPRPSFGFRGANRYLTGLVRQANLAGQPLIVIPIAPMLQVVADLLRVHPSALG